MITLITLKQAVIVEGKYDKIKLSNFLDAFIITTDGFGVFKDKEKRELIRLLAKENGIIIMTDSDSAGMVIRNYIKSFVKEGEIIQVYLPQIKGKEKRKVKISAQGFLGVEGLSEECIKNALANSGIENHNNSGVAPFTKVDLYELGISGRENSSALRKKVLNEMCLPEYLSTSSLLEYVNRCNKHNYLIRVCEKCLQEEDKK